MIKFIERPFRDEHEFPGEVVVGVSMYHQDDSIEPVRWKYRGTISLPKKEWADLKETIQNSDLSGMIYRFEDGA